MNRNFSEKTSGSFFILPKSLIDDPIYSRLSSNAILLYGLMLDRMKLSAMNGRDYVYFTLKSVMSKLKCSKNTAVKALRELESASLIFKSESPAGKPVRYRVVQPDGCRKSDRGDVGKRDSGVSESDSGVYRNSDSNNTYMNNTALSNTLFTEDEVRTNIGYDYLVTVESREDVDSVVSVICDALNSQVRYFHIGKDVYPRELVKSRLLSVNEEHVVYVLDTLSRTRSEIRDIRTYVLKLLFNAPSSMSLYYTAKVSADMRSGEI